jgi:hypothetical protein
MAKKQPQPRVIDVDAEGNQQEADAEASAAARDAVGKHKRNPGTRLTEEEKSAIIAMILCGHNNEYISQQTRVYPEVINKVRKRVPPALIDNSQVNIEENKNLREKLLAKYNSVEYLVAKHLEVSLKGATAIAEKAMDAEWLHKQNAAELGTLYGILTDKSIRVLDALARRDDIQSRVSQLPPASEQESENYIETTAGPSS